MKSRLFALAECFQKATIGSKRKLSLFNPLHTLQFLQLLAHFYRVAYKLKIKCICFGNQSETRKITTQPKTDSLRAQQLAWNGRPQICNIRRAHTHATTFLPSTSQTTVRCTRANTPLHLSAACNMLTDVPLLTRRHKHENLVQQRRWGRQNSAESREGMCRLLWHGN